MLQNKRLKKLPFKLKKKQERLHREPQNSQKFQEWEKWDGLS